MGLAEPEFRQVTVAYLHELYEEIRERRDEAATCRELLERLGYDWDKVRQGRFDGAVPAEVFEDEHLGLSPRQAEVLALFAAGRRREHVAETLGITINTVTSHVVEAQKRLGGRNIVHTVAEAIRAGLIR